MFFAPPWVLKKKKWNCLAIRIRTFCTSVTPCLSSFGSFWQILWWYCKQYQFCYGSFHFKGEKKKEGMALSKRKHLNPPFFQFLFTFVFFSYLFFFPKNIFFPIIFNRHKVSRIDSYSNVHYDTYRSCISLPFCCLGQGEGVGGLAKCALWENSIVTS